MKYTAPNMAIAKKTVEVELVVADANQVAWRPWPGIDERRGIPHEAAR